MTINQTKHVDVLKVKISEAESLQKNTYQKLEPIYDPVERQTLLREIAGREGLLATLRRELAELNGDKSAAKRDHNVRVRLTDQEHTWLSTIANEEKCTISEYIRRAILAKIAEDDARRVNNS